MFYDWFDSFLFYVMYFFLFLSFCELRLCFFIIASISFQLIVFV